MVLESTIICFDSSDYMNNGDFLPSRLYAQKDIVQAIFRSKARSNPENDFGLITLAKNTDILAPLTPDVNKVLAKLGDVKASGNMNFLVGVKRAHLVLKHRKGKNHKTIIIAFVGSPIDDSEIDVIKCGKVLRKEKVTVFVINFGELDSNTGKLTSFINAINGADLEQKSFLVNVPTGSSMLDTIRNSPIMGGEGTLSEVDEFGVDPDEDPELALALRLSMQEQGVQREVQRREMASVESAGEAMLGQALNFGAQDYESNVAANIDFANMTEDEQIAFAIQMSMENHPNNQEEDVEMKDEEKKDENM